MAQLSLADISAAMSLTFIERGQNQINRNAVLLNILGIKKSGGKSLNWTCKFSGRTNAAGFVEGADMLAGDFDQELRVPAILNWGMYRKGAKVSGLALAANASNYNPASVFDGFDMDVFQDECSDAVHRMSLGIASDMYLGSGLTANPIVGLDKAISAAGVYATIDPAVNTEHVSTVHSSTFLTVTLDKLRAFHTAIYIACGELPEFMVCDPATFDKIGSLFGPERRYVTDLTTASKGKVVLSTGFTAIEVDGIPYIRDRHASSAGMVAGTSVGVIYGINSNYVDICELPAVQSAMTQDKFLAIMRMISSERLPAEAYGELMSRNAGLTPYIEMLSKTGDGIQAQVKSYCQLRVKRRNGLGKFDVLV